MRGSSKRVSEGAVLLSILALLAMVVPAAAAAPANAPAGAPNLAPAQAPAPAQGVVQPAAKAEPGTLPGLIQQPTNQCIEIIVCAKNPDTGQCQEFANPCSVPQGWTIYFDPTTCENA